MASAGDEDLVASKTDGFKVGEKKTVEEYAKLGEPFPDCTSSVVRRCVLQVASTWEFGVAIAPILCGLIRLFRCFDATSISPWYNQAPSFMLSSKKRLSNVQERELRRSVISLTTQVDQNDESLNRWKASLGISNSPALPVDPKDTRRCVIHSLALEVPGRSDITIDLSVPGALESLKSKPFFIKEGAKFRMKASFKVQHDVLSGLKYLQVVKRKGIRVSKDEEMLGSYAPNTQEKPVYEKKFAEDEAPSGMMARGHYEAVSKFVDDDDHTHLKFEWSFDIAKDWK